MRRLAQKILGPFFIWLAEKFSAAPKKVNVFKSLSALYRMITTKKTSRGIVLPVDPFKDRFIIFSDQHKGTRRYDDDFLQNEVNYVAALDHYNAEKFHFINLGDAEELWKQKADEVTKAYKATLQKEALFHVEKRYYRTFGNHDIQWKNNLDVMLHLKDIFTMPLPVYEGIVLRMEVDNTGCDVFLTHGHQGDKMSDNNAFSTWVIAHIWAPAQRLLRINVNTPANDYALRNKHNKMMYDWASRRKNIFLITGHTHKPVFASGRYAEKESHKIGIVEQQDQVKPAYFNTGCCCFNDGDITGIEIADGNFRLIKWHNNNNVPQRIVLDEKPIVTLLKDML